MSRQPESDEMQIEPLGALIVEQRVGCEQVLHVPKKPLEIKRVITGVEQLGAVDAVEIESHRVEVIEERVEFECIERLHHDRIVKGLCGTRQFGEHDSYPRWLRIDGSAAAYSNRPGAPTPAAWEQ